MVKNIKGMRKLWIICFLMLVSGLLFSQEKKGNENTETQKIVKQVPKAKQNQTQIRKTQTKKKQIRRTQIQKRKSMQVANKKKTIQRRRQRN